MLFFLFRQKDQGCTARHADGPVPPPISNETVIRFNACSVFRAAPPAPCQGPPAYLYADGFLWARVDYASRASKKAPQGLFPPPDCSAGRCCSNPPLRCFVEVQIKQKLQRHHNAGVLGGRGWIRTSSTITIRWMRFEIVMDSCAFFEFHQKSIIGYHNHLGTKTGYKVGYFARGEYSASASETAIAAVSALPSTAWLYQP